jgi:hypothetical protein
MPKKQRPPPDPSKPRKTGANKWPNRLKRAEVQNQMLKMLHLGYPQRVVAEKFGVSQESISSLKKRTFTKLYEERLNDGNAKVMEMVAIQQEIRLLALRGYYKSCRDKVRRIEEWAPLKKDATGKPRSTPQNADVQNTLRLLKAINTKEGRIPDNSFLMTMIETCKEECKLLAVYPKEDQKVGAVILTSWEEMRGVVRPPDPMTDIEERIARLAGPSNIEEHPNE